MFAYYIYVGIFFCLNLYILAIKCERLVYTRENAVEIFDMFKRKYNKHYKNSDEERNKFQTFINNLNEMENLNENENDVKYSVNRFSDMTSEETEEQFAARIPYDSFKVADNLRDRGDVIQAMDEAILYDLHKARDLYNTFKTKYHKRYKNNDEDTEHFYRFVKTLVETNRKNVASNTNHEIKFDADVIKEPHQLFFTF